MDADLFARASWGNTVPRHVEREGYRVQQKVRPLGSGISRAGGGSLFWGGYCSGIEEERSRRPSRRG